MSRSVVNYLRRFRPAIAQQNELSAYCVVHLLIAYEMVSHKDAYYLLCLHQVRLAGSSIMFYVCPSVRSTITKLVNRVFWKRVNHFWRKLAEVFRGTRAQRSTLGSGGQRSRSLEAEIGHINPFPRDFSRTIRRFWTKPSRHVLRKCHCNSDAKGQRSLESRGRR